MWDGVIPGLVSLFSSASLTEVNRGASVWETKLFECAGWESGTFSLIPCYRHTKHCELPSNEKLWDQSTTPSVATAAKTWSWFKWLQKH